MQLYMRLFVVRVHTILPKPGSSPAVNTKCLQMLNARADGQRLNSERDREEKIAPVDVISLEPVLNHGRK